MEGAVSPHAARELVRADVELAENRSSGSEGMESIKDRPFGFKFLKEGLGILIAGFVALSLESLDLIQLSFYYYLGIIIILIIILFILLLVVDRIYGWY